MANSVNTLGEREARVALEVMQSAPIVDITVLGEPASKANSRKWTGRLFIKSDKARSYGDGFALQVRPLPELLVGDMFAAIHIAYASRRSDTDESLILDLLQGRIIKNDRAIRHRLTTHSIDKANPRCRIRLWPWPS